jgi:hypothetical protein
MAWKSEATLKTQGEEDMSAALDALIRKAHNLEIQIAQLTAELMRLRDAIAGQMGDEHEYFGHGVMARKWARVRWQINKELLLDALPPEALAYLKEVVFTKEKLAQAVRAGYLPPRLYDRAMQREDEGWNVSVKVLALPAAEPDWELEEDLREEGEAP